MKRLSLLALTGLLIAGLALPAAMSAAPPSRTALFNDIPVTGTLGNGDPFAGTLDITEITRDGSTLLFDGTLTNTATGAVQQFTDVAATLVQPGATSRDQRSPRRGEPPRQPVVRRCGDPGWSAGWRPRRPAGRAAGCHQ
jgi:hypothetical protein